ncbi:MAG: enoyl-CoA hydratase-related protein [Acidimicrobiia bacterium]
MAYDGYRLLKIEVTEHIARVTFDLPERHNRYTIHTHTELARIVGELALDPDVHSILVTANGKTFCAGADDGVLAAVNENKADLRRALDEARTQVHGLVDIDKPIVIALTGTAMGAGLALVLLADIIIAERHVRFTDGHVLAAMPAGDGGALAWPASVGIIRAKRYLLTGDPISAEEAERIGLITEVVDTGAAKARAEVYAKRFADGPQRAIRFTKRSLNQWLKARLDSFDLSLAYEEATFESGDVARAVREIAEHGRTAIAPDQR